jgi:hypothetical protein
MTLYLHNVPDLPILLLFMLCQIYPPTLEYIRLIVEFIRYYLIVEVLMHKLDTMNLYYVYSSSCRYIARHFVVKRQGSGERGRETRTLKIQYFGVR